MVFVEILYGIGLLIGLFALELLLVALVPGFDIPPQPLRKAPPSGGQESALTTPSRRDVRFLVDGTAVSAWLYYLG